MVRFRPYLAELTRALLVLALILLNLGHQSTPAVAYDGTSFTYDVAVNCGAADTPDQMGHAPCHACRLGGDAVLPPPPLLAKRVERDLAEVIYSAIVPQPQADFRVTANRSRGPPLNA